MTGLAGKHALVTGASRGIGAAIARALAADGARVSLLARDAATLAELVQSAGADAALALTADVTDAGSVAAAFALARRRFGGIQILINNAGQAASARFTDTDAALWNRMLAVNLTGSYLCAREALSDMLPLGFGRIVNIASTAGLRGGAYIAAYSASKHGVIGMTRSLALEYAAKNLTVNAVCPGFVNTDIVKEAIANIRARTGRSESEALAALLATNPQRRLIEPEEVAHVALWLCRPGTESVTGQSIILSGGEVS
jgi:3-hydroxybutyrate dehydrogenase